MAKKVDELVTQFMDRDAIRNRPFAETFERVFNRYGVDFWLRLEARDGRQIDQWLMYDDDSPTTPAAVMAKDDVKYSPEPIEATFYVRQDVEGWKGDSYPVKIVGTSTIPAQWKEPPSVLATWAPRVLIGLGVAGAVAGGVALAKKAKVL